MKLTNQQREVFEKDVEVGRLAKIAYDSYIRNYIYEHSLNLYQDFINADSLDINLLTSIKIEQKVLNDLEGNLLMAISIAEQSKTQLIEA